MVRAVFPLILPNALLLASLVVALEIGVSGPARAQQTSSVSSLFVSNGSELDFKLYGTTGGAGTNGTNSDLIAVANQFNFSGTSAGSYIVGFGHGDTTALTPGSIYTLVTFGSTDFTSADAARFQAQPSSGSNVSQISGTFLLNILSGGNGSLQFQLGNEADMPEPSALLLLASSVLGISTTGMGGLLAARLRKR